MINLSTFVVDKEFRQVEELRDELLDVRGRLEAGEAPGCPHTVERPVGDVKAAVCNQSNSKTHKNRIV